MLFCGPFPTQHSQEYLSILKVHLALCNNYIVFYFMNIGILAGPLLMDIRECFRNLFWLQRVALHLCCVASEQVPRHGMLGCRLSSESVLKIQVLESDGLGSNPRTGTLWVCMLLNLSVSWFPCE